MLMVSKVEVKVIRKLEYLPQVFITNDLNKFSITRDYVNCGKYTSRSGLTVEGCVQVTAFNNRLVIDSMKEVRGIYYIPVASIISLIYRQKVIRSLNDLKEILSTVDLSKVSLKQSMLLIKYHGYVIDIFDVYFKAKIYEFPLLSQQGHLKVHEIPPIRNAYLIFYENNQEKKEINRDLFVEVGEVMSYNHRITFSNPVLELKNVFVTPGAGMIVYVEKDTHVTLQSPDHETKEFNINRDTWVLFSHPRPQKNKAD